jgi:hypothetical protein
MNFCHGKMLSFRWLLRLRLRKLSIPTKLECVI